MSGYIAGFNQPGYLPESEPEEFDDFDEAKRYIINEIKKSEDGFAMEGDEDGAENLSALAEDVNLERGPFSVLGADGYAYWVADADDNAETGAWESLDDDEDEDEDDLDDEDDDY